MKLGKFIFGSISLILITKANAYTLELNNGYFFGPGNAVYVETGLVGINRFPDAQVRNIILTGPLTGIIPFFNNGAAEPNVIAEKLADSAIVDGFASDGAKINENADTALALHFTDPTTGEIADLAVIAECSEREDCGEPILPDIKGNLTFGPNIVADPGYPEGIARFAATFTTGVVEIPLSLKTQNGEPGGADNAGPLKAGDLLIGRLGDYDNNGYLDGRLVLAANAPLDLLVGRGNPIAQIRPWESDIPIEPGEAIFLTLNNILQNYPFAFARHQQRGDFLSIVTHLNDMDLGVNAILGNMRKITLPANNPQVLQIVNQIRRNLARVQRLISNTTTRIDLLGINAANPGSNFNPDKMITQIGLDIQQIFTTLTEVADDFTILRGGSSAASVGNFSSPDLNDRS